MDQGTFLNVVKALSGHSILDFIEFLLSAKAEENSHFTELLVNDTAGILDVLSKDVRTEHRVRTFSVELCCRVARGELVLLARKQSGWHFSAKHASADAIEQFSIQGMTETLRQKAPITWGLVSALLACDLERELERAAHQSTGGSAGVDWTEEDEYWARDAEGVRGTEDDEASHNDAEGGRKAKRRKRAGERQLALANIRCCVVISTFLFSTNQQCNSLPSVIGLFCHSTSAPEILIEMLAHAGYSISLTAIQDLVTSLSGKSLGLIRRLAQTLLAAFAYDNFDMEFKSSLPALDKPGSTSKHATSGLVFKLNHGVVPDDLKCSKELWARDPHNLSVPASQRAPVRTWMDCLPAKEPDNEPPQAVRILAWHFRHALVNHTPEFNHFNKEAILGKPETILQIPLTKTEFIPCRAMDINQSTTDGQGDIVDSLYGQANVGDPTDHPEVNDVREHVILFHGDLRTGELLDAIQRSRSIEDKEVRRMQGVRFVFGLFHYLMAAADAIWRMYIEPKTYRTDPNGLFAQMCAIHPYDSSRLAKGAKFRPMHELIQRCAIARMLVCFEVELKKKGHPSLAAYAQSNPSWDDIIQLSISLVGEYVDKRDHNDTDFRSNSIILARLLQYVELAHSMKHGDIGRVEATFLQWAFIFKSVGKHKYAKHLILTLNNLKYFYPLRMTRAFRLNWLINLTGAPDGFRAVDWLVELMNLYTKVVYASLGSARTFDLILKQSPLIQVFRHTHTLIQENFHLLHRSTRHAPPNLEVTLRTLIESLNKHGAYTVGARADSQSTPVKDHFGAGMLEFQTEKQGAAIVEEAEEEGELEEDDFDV